jgi:hypothetical protein
MTRSSPSPVFLTRTIADDRYPLSPRVRSLQAILDNLVPPPAVAAKHYPASRPGDRPRALVNVKLDPGRKPQRRVTDKI